VQYGGQYNVHTLDQQTAQGVAGPTVSGGATGFTESGNTLYFAGGFGTVNGQSRAGLAAVDAQTSSLLPWNPAGSGTSTTPVSLAGNDDAVYVGGGFDTFGNEPQSNLAAYANAPVAAARLVWPAQVTVAPHTVTPQLYGEVAIGGATGEPGVTPGLAVQLGVGPDGSNPATDPGWQWFNASYVEDAGGPDHYAASFTTGNAGEYDYAYRYSYYDGAWVYSDLDGIDNGYSPSQAGRLIVSSTTSTPPRPRELAFALAGRQPARGDVQFRIELPSDGRVRLQIHDVTGRRIATVIDGDRTAGPIDAAWAASARSGVAPGVYYARLGFAGRVLQQRFVLLR
jgi:hypothetical protein